MNTPIKQIKTFIPTNWIVALESRWTLMKSIQSFFCTDCKQNYKKKTYCFGRYHEKICRKCFLNYYDERLKGTYTLLASYINHIEKQKISAKDPKKESKDMIAQLKN